MPKLFITALLCLACCMAKAQDNARFTSYSVDDGLPQSSIYDVGQDSNGFIWIGTAGGLCRFDGYQFKTYLMAPQDPHAITGYKEFRFYNDRSGRLWIVHFNGISIYNEMTDDFTNVLTYAPRNVVMAENHFYGEDEGFIWVGLCSYGIVKVDKHTLRVHNTPLTKTLHRPGNNVGYHGFLQKGKLWIVDNNESATPVFFRYDTKTGGMDTLQIPIVDIINLNDSEALGLTHSTVVVINKETLSQKHIPLTPNGSVHNVMHMYRAPDNKVILSSSTQGLFYVDAKAGKTTRHIALYDVENKNAFLTAKCAFTDRSGNTWVGTQGDGLFKMSYPYKNFRWYRSPLAGSNNVFGIAVDSTDLYVGILAHGITIFSHGGGFRKNITLNKGLATALNSVYTISPLKKDKLIALATSAKDNGRHIPFIYTKSTGTFQLPGKEVRKLYADLWGRGNLRHFIFPDKAGNFITNVGEYLVALTACDNKPICGKVLNRFTGESLTSGFCDRNGNLWVGSFSGIFFNGGSGWKRIELPKNKEIKNISQDPDGNIWMGSNDEVIVLNKNHKVISSYTVDNGLVDAHLYALLKDQDGNMWLSHNKGLSVFRWREKKFEHFGKEDGLQSSEFNISSCAQSADGELFFGGINGVTAFYPREILHNPNAPRVMITGIKLFEEPYITDTAYWKIRNIQLPYTENSISFEFALPEFTNTPRNRYQFSMEGVDAVWIDAGDRRFARYAGLRPGNYTFKVKGANNDGIWGAATAIQIIIVPPFWQTTWFTALVIVTFLILSVGVGIFIQKLRQRKAIRAMELQHRIQVERERISRDLHDNVGTQLSLISKNIEGVIAPLENISDGDRIKNLKNISQTSKEVIFTLRETIWALNREEISLEELSDKLKSFTQKLFEINRDCRLQYSEEIGNDAVVLGPSEAIHLFRICQEAITNSLKYANATTMEINISAKGPRYRIVISDNGVGFDQVHSSTHAHYGLDNMKYRSEEIDCNFSIESDEGKGTTISIQKR